MRTVGPALAAGILAAVNPCGFALLPAYVALLVVDSEQGRFRRTLSLSSGVTLGFVTVFGVFGLLHLATTDRLTIVIGVTLVILGVWLGFGRDRPSPVAKHPKARDLTNRFGSMFLFGAAFALASLSSATGPYRAVVTGIGPFLAYTGGVALVAGTVSFGVALAQQPLIGWRSRHTAATERVAGTLTALGGAYVAWYGWYAVRLAKDPSTADPIVRAVTEVQTRLAAGLDRVGAVGLAITLAVLAIGLIVARSRRRARTSPRSTAPRENIQA